eukprot:Sspe_Gene.7634::Locus_2585_Transcript_1_1_Confidence_1.000_Length_941::g.7634::m.7634/K06911/K06911; uncharacterized protein
MGECISTDGGSPRKVINQFRAAAFKEGGGLRVRRSIGDLSRLTDSAADPFLLVDEYGPGELLTKNSPCRHPHKGMQVVSFLIDSDKFDGVRWLNAGSGVDEQEGGCCPGEVHGVHIWVNLPKAHKLSPPCLQEVGKVPVVFPAKGVTVRVVAGECAGVQSPIKSVTPVTILHVTLDPLTTYQLSVPRGYSAFVYIHGEGGSGLVSGIEASSLDVLVFGTKGDHIAVETREQPLRFILLAGEPIREPVARWGPFILNSRSEVKQTLTDYKRGNLARVPPKVISYP